MLLWNWENSPVTLLEKKYRYEHNQFWNDMILRSSKIWNKVIEWRFKLFIERYWKYWSLLILRYDLWVDFVADRAKKDLDVILRISCDISQYSLNQQCREWSMWLESSGIFWSWKYLKCFLFCPRLKLSYSYKSYCSWFFSHSLDIMTFTVKNRV